MGAELTNVLTLLGAPSPPRGGLPPPRFTTGSVGRATSSSTTGAFTPGVAITRSSLSGSQPHARNASYAEHRTANFDPVYMAREKDHECGLVHASLPCAHLSGGYTGNRPRMSPKQSPRVDQSPPPPVARTMSPPVPLFRRHVCGAAQGHVMSQTMGGNRASVWYG